MSANEPLGFTDPYGSVHYPRVQSADKKGVPQSPPPWNFDGDVWDVTGSLLAGCFCGWHGATLATSRAEAESLNARAQEAWEADHLPHVQNPQAPAELAAALDTVRRLLPQYAATEPLTALRLARELEDAAKDAALRSVVAVRRRRGSWDVIGGVLGISKQTAHARYAGRIRVSDVTQP